MIGKFPTLLVSRRPRQTGVDWSGARSWLGGAPCLGATPWPRDRSGEPLEAYLYQVADNEQCMRDWGHQCVVWQTALGPAVALELLATGAWSGTGVLGPEAFEPQPFLDLMAELGSPHGFEDRTTT